MTDSTNRRPVELTEEELALVTQNRAAANDYDRDCRRLRAAGKRARIGEEMRRAAIAEMGQTLRDNRAAAKGDGPQSDYKIDMEQAENLTMFSRRTLSAAIGDTSRTSDRDLADHYRTARYDLHDGGHELHRRYPWLAGVHAARMALWSAQPEDTVEELLKPNRPIVAPPGDDVLDTLYKQMVDAIADGDTGMHTDAGGYSDVRLPFWADGEPPLRGAAD